MDSLGSKARGAGADTVLGRVVALLAEVEGTTVPVLRILERRAAVWLPLVLTLAATALFFTENLSRAIALLVVAGPTALVVAVPTALVVAVPPAPVVAGPPAVVAAVIGSEPQ